jgi:predicted nucleic acid-binding protein
LTVLVDTNVLLDIVTQNPVWMGPSLFAIEQALMEGAVVINDVIYAELSIGLDTVDDVDAILETIGVRLAPISRHALVVAGKAFKRYRRAGGTRTGVLPDFFIGAHAEVDGLTVLTRDPKRYRTYFATVDLIVPAV